MKPTILPNNKTIRESSEEHKERDYTHKHKKDKKENFLNINQIIFDNRRNFNNKFTNLSNNNFISNNKFYNRQINEDTVIKNTNTNTINNNIMTLNKSDNIFYKEFEIKKHMRALDFITKIMMSFDSIDNKKNLEKIVSVMKDFFSKQGSIGKFYLEELEILNNFLKKDNNVKLFLPLSSNKDSRFILFSKILKESFPKDDREIDLAGKKLISKLEECRYDKEDTGFNHTLLQAHTSNGLASHFYLLMNSYSDTHPFDQSVRNTVDVMKKIRGNANFVTPHLSPNFNNQEKKVVLGEGHFGKVRLALRLDTNEVVAVKKSKKIDSAYREFTNAKIIKERFSKNMADNYFMLPYDMAICKGKDDLEKCYLFMPLAAGGDDLNRVDQAFQLRHSSNSNTRREGEIILARLFLHWSQVLAASERAGLAFTDCKIKNFVDGKLCDISDMWIDDKRENITKKPNSMTRVYVAPETARFEQGYSGKAYMSFALGVMLLIAITGALPENPKHELHLPRATDGDKFYKRGYWGSEAIPTASRVHRQLQYTTFDQKILKIAQDLMLDKPEQRTGCDKAWKKIQQVIRKEGFI